MNKADQIAVEALAISFCVFAALVHGKSANEIAKNPPTVKAVACAMPEALGALNALKRFYYITPKANPSG